MGALRHYRSLRGADGQPLVWREPRGGSEDPVDRAPGAYGGDFGFLDSYTLDMPSGEPWVAHDYVAIDQGPLILAIENARSGLIWELFRAHEFAALAEGRLGLERRAEP